MMVLVVGGIGLYALYWFATQAPQRVYREPHQGAEEVFEAEKVSESTIQQAAQKSANYGQISRIASKNSLQNINWNNLVIPAQSPSNANRAKKIDETQELVAKIKPNPELSVGFWWLINFYIFAKKKGVYELELVKKTQTELLTESAVDVLGAVFEGAKKGMDFGVGAGQVVGATLNMVLKLIENTAKETAIRDQRTAIGQFAAEMVLKFGLPPTSLLNFAIWAGVPQMELQNPEDWFRYFEAILKRAIELEFNVAQFAPKNLGRFYQKQDPSMVAYPVSNDIANLSPRWKTPRSWFWYAFDARNLLEYCLTSDILKRPTGQFGGTYTALIRANQNAETVGQFAQNDWNELWSTVFPNDWFSTVLFSVGYDPTIAFQNNEVDLLDFTDIFPTKGGSIQLNYNFDESSRPAYMANFQLSNFLEDNWLITAKRGRKI